MTVLLSWDEWILLGTLLKRVRILQMIEQTASLTKKAGRVFGRRVKIIDKARNILDDIVCAQEWSTKGIQCLRIFYGPVPEAE